MLPHVHVAMVMGRQDLVHSALHCARRARWRSCYVRGTRRLIHGPTSESYLDTLLARGFVELETPIAAPIVDAAQHSVEAHLRTSRSSLLYRASRFLSSIDSPHNRHSLRLPMSAPIRRLLVAVLAEDARRTDLFVSLVGLVTGRELQKKSHHILRRLYLSVLFQNRNWFEAWCKAV